MQELVQEVAVGGVHFNAVETRFHGHLRAMAVGLDHAGQLGRFQRARGDVGTLGAHMADMAAGRDGAGRNGQFAVQEDGVGNAAHMPKLGRDQAAFFVHGRGHFAPALHLLGRPQAGGVGVAHALRGHGSGFGQDQARAGALGVVLDHQVVGHAAFAGALARQGGHDEAVAQRQRANAQGFKQGAHAKSFRPGVMGRGAQRHTAWRG
ncbi:hypothetical protein D3C73_832330 [compost metagenome]